MIEAVLKAHLHPIAKRHRRTRLLRILSRYWILAGVLCLGWICALWISGWSLPLWFPAVILLPLLLGGWVHASVEAGKQKLDYNAIARNIEQENPQLHTLLRTAVEQEPDAEHGGKLSFLQERVVREALEENARQPWAQKYDERYLNAQALHAGTLSFAALSLLGLLGASLSPFLREPGALPITEITITPGDAEVEKGSRLPIMVEFPAGQLPQQATLLVLSSQEPERRIPLARSLEDPIYGTSLPQVDHDLLYRVEYDAAQSRDFRITVFEHPRLEQSDAIIQPPDYAERPKEVIEKTRRVTVLENSSLIFQLLVNKVVETAELRDRDSEETLSLVPLSGKSNRFTIDIPSTHSRQFDLFLRDSKGRTNKYPERFVVDVLPNRRPEMKLVFPRGDQELTPVEELHLSAEISDDIHLGRYGLELQVPGQPPVRVELGNNVAGGETITLSHIVAIEDLNLEPNQLFTYHLWAEDKGPEGQWRESQGDLFFVEIRPFEQVFRESPQQSQNQQGQSGSGQGTQELVQLQKNVILATWNIRSTRLHNATRNKFIEDATVVLDSQQAVQELLQQEASQITTEEATAFVQQANDAMERAQEHLETALDDVSLQPLSPALEAEQAALLALLQLQEHQFQVAQSSQSSSGRGGGSSPRQQMQLSQMNLREQENRYETESQATGPQDPQQREQLQILSRLQDLARRQQDINERLKELQVALQEAQTEEEKEELRRQLKRLQEEQERILADMDEVRQRMNQPINQSQTSEARRQLDQARQDVQRASERLQMQDVSQALASGSRAQESFQNLKEDFRQRTSSQFAEQMQQLRSDTRQLADQQEKIGQEVQDFARNRNPSLSDSEDRKETANALRQQREQLEKVLQQMRQISQESESSEPLLSEQLYDSLRQFNQSQVTEQLDASAEMLQRGFVHQSAQAEELARSEILKLQEQVETAANRVLGDEADALRFANRELENLSHELENEIQENFPSGTSTNRTPLASGTAASNSSTNTNSSSLLQAANRNASSQDPQSPSETGNQPQLASANTPSQDQESSGNNSQPASNGNGNGNGNPQSREQVQDRQQQSNQNQNQGETQGQGQGQNPGQGQEGNQDSRQGGGGGNQNQNSGSPFFFENLAGGPGGAPGGPLTGGTFNEWSDRMRDVEQALSDPQLRNRLAQIRERAREARIEFTRHGKEPQWEMVESQIMEPLGEIRQWVNQELMRLESREAMVPIDRDPVPRQFDELVRNYYEALGSGEAPQPSNHSQP